MGCLLLDLYRIILGGWQLVPSALGEVPGSRQMGKGNFVLVGKHSWMRMVEITVIYLMMF